MAHIDHRPAIYLFEMNIKQAWLGQHAGGWSFEQPKEQRIQEG